MALSTFSHRLHFLPRISGINLRDGLFTKPFRWSVCNGLVQYNL